MTSPRPRPQSDRPELAPDALRAAIDAGGTVSSIARGVGADRKTVRTAMRAAGIETPTHTAARRHPELDNRGWLVYHYVRNRESMADIAERLGVRPDTVSRALKRHGVGRRRSGYQERRNEESLRDEEWLRRRFIREHATVAAIARQLDVPERWVRNALRRFGIVRRPSGRGRQ